MIQRACGLFFVVALVLAAGCAKESRNQSHAPPASASGLTIVDDGKSDYSIAVPPNASPAVKLAADELAKYFEQISGASLPVRQGEGELGKVIFVTRTPD